VCARGACIAAGAETGELRSTCTRLATSVGPSASPLDGGSVCHRRCKCPVDSCAGCDRSRWLLSDLGCLKRQAPSVDTRRCVPHPQHPRAQLPVGLSVACTFCASIFLVARVNCLASFAANTRDRDPGGRAAGAQWCLSTVAIRARCFERRSGVHGCRRTVRHGYSRTACSIRYRPPGIRCVFPWSSRSIGDFDRIGSSVLICPARRLTALKTVSARGAGMGSLPSPQLHC